MMTIDIEFYDKKTEFIADEIRILVPKNIVFTAAESENINYINARPFDVSEQMKEYVIQHYPEHVEKFDLYDPDFIGREGVPEGY